MVNKPFENVTLTGQGPNPPVTVAPDVRDMPSTPGYNYPVDPSTGFPESVIRTGSCPENALGETRTLPLEMNSVQVPPQDSYGPSFGKKDSSVGEIESAAEDAGEAGE